MKHRTPVICDRCRKRGYLGEDDFRSLAPILDFTPVPRQCKRHDGWTPERQRGFIEALARTGSVTRAAAAVNMAKEGAYQLRLHPEAGEFRRAWAAALDYGTRILADEALDRAIHGVPVPIMYQGEQVAERRIFNERLTIWHLQHRMPEKFGGAPRVGRGTRHPDTLAREEAEARSEEQRQEEADRTRRFFEVMLMHYANRVRLERLHREEGDIDNADYYMRQLTMIELTLEFGKRASDLLEIATERDVPGRPWTRKVKSSPLTDVLARMREEGWRMARDGQPEHVIGEKMRQLRLEWEAEERGEG